MDIKTKVDKLDIQISIRTILSIYCKLNGGGGGGVGVLWLVVIYIWYGTGCTVVPPPLYITVYGEFSEFLTTV